MNYMRKSYVVFVVLGLPKGNLAVRRYTLTTLTFHQLLSWNANIVGRQLLIYTHKGQRATLAFIWSPSTGHKVKNEHVFCPLWYRAGVVRWVFRHFSSQTAACWSQRETAASFHVNSSLKANPFPFSPKHVIHCQCWLYVLKLSAVKQMIWSM